MDEEREQDSAAHEPSANRLQRAAEHGMVPYSVPLAAAVQWLGGILAIAMFLGWAGQLMLDIATESWSGAMLSGGPPGGLWDGLIKQLALVLCVFMLGLCALGLIFHGWQKGFKPPQRQHFDLYQIMPFARKSRRSWGERAYLAGLRGLQLAIVLGVAYFVLRNSGAQIFALWHARGEMFARLLGDVIVRFGIVIASSLLWIGLMDYAWQWFAHRRRLRMTDVELREENRLEEGDPRLRQRRREVHRRLTSRSRRAG